MGESTDVAVVGSGIAGLACALMFSKRGRRVTVIEKDPTITGASARNFGMIWPIGQPVGARRDLAMRSGELWLELLREAGIWHAECGSLHLAQLPDEAEVLAEFLALCPDAGRLMCPEEATTFGTPIRSESLQMALRSESELCVDPRTVNHEIARHLETRYGVEFKFNTVATSAADGQLETSAGLIRADQIVLCPGVDVAPLMGPTPNLGQPVRLQMMRTAPTDQISSHLCAGLTLLHYGNFAECPSLPAVRKRLAERWPEQIARGIHVLVSQHGDGSLTLGDSHASPPFSPYDDMRTDALIMEYLDTFFRTENLRVTHRWNGTYLKHPEEAFCFTHPEPGISALTSLGGAGMTLSFGVAERFVREVSA